jgi:hypothetical protein
VNTRPVEEDGKLDLVIDDTSLAAGGSAVPLPHLAFHGSGRHVSEAMELARNGRKGGRARSVQGLSVAFESISFGYTDDREVRYASHVPV